MVCKLERKWKLIKVLRWLGSAPLVSGKQMERAIGHATFVLMLRRPLLSILRDVYMFIQNRPYHLPTRLPAEAARECRAAAALVPFAVADLRPPFSPKVSAFDASPGGMGVGEPAWSEQDVRTVSRYDDRWRFRLGKYDRVPARVNSHLSLGWQPQKPMHMQVYSEWSLDRSFPEVPQRLMSQSWSTVVCAPLQRSEPIGMLEARTWGADSEEAMP